VLGKATIEVINQAFESVIGYLRLVGPLGGFMLKQRFKLTLLYLQAVEELGG